ALVAVEHEDRQQAVGQLRPDDLGAAEIELGRVRLLAEDDDVVPGPPQLARDRARVHVRARAPEQIPVPEQDAHASSLGHVPVAGLWTVRYRDCPSDATVPAASG